MAAGLWYNYHLEELVYDALAMLIAANQYMQQRKTLKGLRKSSRLVSYLELSRGIPNPQT